MPFERKYPPFETRERIEQWCARQERAHSEVKHKLFTWGVQSEEADQLISELISENFLNEERFARAFTSGKFKLKKWGLKKIENQLKQKGVSGYSIALARQEVDEDDYTDTLYQLIKKKDALIKSSNHLERKKKLQRYAVNKGYGFEEVNKVINEITQSS